VLDMVRLLSFRSPPKRGMPANMRLGPKTIRWFSSHVLCDMMHEWTATFWANGDFSIWRLQQIFANPMLWNFRTPLVAKPYARANVFSRRSVSECRRTADIYGIYQLEEAGVKAPRIADWRPRAWERDACSFQ
jgi:hypothetical protein